MKYVLIVVTSLLLKAERNAWTAELSEPGAGVLPLDVVVVEVPVPVEPPPPSPNPKNRPAPTTITTTTTTAAITVLETARCKS